MQSPPSPRPLGGTLFTQNSPPLFNNSTKCGTMNLFEIIPHPLFHTMKSFVEGWTIKFTYRARNFLIQEKFGLPNEEQKRNQAVLSTEVWNRRM